MPNVLAFAESRSGDLRRAGLEAVTAARIVADAMGGEVHAVIFGAAGVAKHAAALGAHGADKVLVVEHAGFTHNNPEAVSATIAARAKDGSYGAFVCAASATGKDIAPRVAAKLGVPLISDSKPGDRDYNGGRWHMNVLKAGVDPSKYANACRVEDLNLSDFESTPNYFECPLLPRRGNNR